MAQEQWSIAREEPQPKRSGPGWVGFAFLGVVAAGVVAWAFWPRPADTPVVGPAPSGGQGASIRPVQKAPAGTSGGAALPPGAGEKKSSGAPAKGEAAGQPAPGAGPVEEPAKPAVVSVDDLDPGALTTEVLEKELKGTPDESAIQEIGQALARITNLRLNHAQRQQVYVAARKLLPGENRDFLIPLACNALDASLQNIDPVEFVSSVAYIRRADPKRPMGEAFALAEQYRVDSRGQMAGAAEVEAMRRFVAAKAGTAKQAMSSLATFRRNGVAPEYLGTLGERLAAAGKEAKTDIRRNVIVTLRTGGRIPADEAVDLGDVYALRTGELGWMAYPKTEVTEVGPAE